MTIIFFHQLSILDYVQMGSQRCFSQSCCGVPDRALWSGTSRCTKICRLPDPHYPKQNFTVNIRFSPSASFHFLIVHSLQRIRHSKRASESRSTVRPSPPLCTSWASASRPASRPSWPRRNRGWVAIDPLQNVEPDWDWVFGGDIDIGGKKRGEKPPGYFDK